MKAKYTKLAREQLDRTLKQLRPLKTLTVPNKGWIRAIRDTLGMTGNQLAKRMGVNKQRVARIEHDERPGSVTINTMRKAAEALDCIFVYGFVPADSLEQTVKNRAEAVAKKRMARSGQTMRLEKQELSQKEKEEAFNSLVKNIIDAMPKSLWDDQW